MGKSNRRSEGQYLPLPYSQIRSDAWRSLSGAAVRLWLELHTRYNGGNNGKLILSYAEAGAALGMGKATVMRAYQDLVEKGFLMMESEGDWYSRRAHEWRLTTKPMQTTKGKVTATQDWHQYRTPKQKRGAASEPSKLSVVPFENPKVAHGSNPRPVKAKSGVL